MVKVVGVRFRNSGKVYYFDPADFEIRRGSRVIVETARGMECGTAALAPREISDDKVIQPLKPVVRLADDADIQREKDNIEKEKEAYKICRQKIREHNLDMKLVQVEYTFDNKKVLFYFTADGRVDFRDLVKDLASVFKTRIELRQIGVRDETRMLGGIGVCGRPLCCSTYLSEFAPVSIKMAKEQNMSLNPSKISGVCGRLMCCLKNEEETYEYLNRQLPGVGDKVETPDHQVGEVSAVNVLRQRVRVLIENDDDKEMEEYAADEITIVSKRRKGPAQQPKKNSDGKETEKENSGRRDKDSRDSRDVKNPKESRNSKDFRDSKSSKDARQSKENREDKANRDSRDSRRENSKNAAEKAENDKPEKSERPEKSGNREGRRRRRGRRHGGGAKQENPPQE